VTLYEAQFEVGGQLLLARRIPGKQEFDELLRWYHHELQRLGIQLRLGCRVQADALAAAHNRVIVATGIVPRRPAIDGVGHRSVVGYLDVILGRVPVGRRVAILGAGGIGHDVAELLAQPSGGDSDGLSAFYSEWGVDASFAARGACAAPVPPSPAGREITILQRSPGRPSALLGKSTGWVVRSRLARRGVQWIGGVQYRRIDDAGLHYADADGLPQTLVVDTVVLCTGQDSDATLADALRGRGIAAEVIGGARDAARLDAARAIDEGTRLAGRL
jgi:2,4-dienoyl-CoA reductase (NADPH2)